MHSAPGSSNVLSQDGGSRERGGKALLWPTAQMGLGVSSKLFGKLENYALKKIFFFWPLVVTFMLLSFYPPKRSDRVFIS